MVKSRNTAQFQIANVAKFKQRALTWAAQYEPCCYLDSNDHRDAHSRYDLLVAIGINSECTDWLFGHISYDFKNQLEALESNHPDGIDMPDMSFFCPDTIVALHKNLVTIHTFQPSAKAVFIKILDQTPIDANPLPAGPPDIQARISKETYLDTVANILTNLQRGDIFEMNFCQEFFAENAVIHPAALFQQLNEATRTPFAAYYRYKHKYLLCASPERYFQKEGKQLRSQPIKGTRPRHADPIADEQLREELRHSPKDLSEHVMIVDLVRNDLSRICLPGSVQVADMYQIRSFQFVHQMVSTIIGKLKNGMDFDDIITATFPMGSMTGAPKIRAMQLAEQYEKTKRGLYSGAVGYISPDQDCDFNVVIRSILYNAETDYLSFQVGGAITIGSDPLAEYDECMTKAAGILRTLGH